MRYIKLMTICLTVVLGTCALATSASAAEDIYKIEGEKLEAGEAVGISASAKTTFVLRSKGALNIEAVTTCKGLKLKGTENPEVIGGTPGTSANEVFELEECSATVGGSKCSSVEITNTKMNNELVTIRAPTGMSGNLATLFTPASGKELYKIKLNKCGIFGNQAATVEGTTAAATSPEGVFEPEGTWAWSESNEITEIEKHNGTTEKVGLKSSSKTVTLSGEAAVKAPEFRASNPANKNIELTTEREAGASIELKLEGLGNRIWCEKEVTFETLNNLAVPTPSIELKPKFPATCKASVGKEPSESVTVEKCGIFKLYGTGTFYFKEECGFKIMFKEFPMCKLTLPAQSLARAVTYGGHEDIAAAIKDPRVTYKTEKCGIGNGIAGEFTAKLVLKGFVGGTMVSIEVK